jgi:hypothetical protein
MSTYYHTNIDYINTNNVYMREAVMNGSGKGRAGEELSLEGNFVALVRDLAEMVGQLFGFELNELLAFVAYLGGSEGVFEVGVEGRFY